VRVGVSCYGLHDSGWMVVYRVERNAKLSEIAPDLWSWSTKSTKAARVSHKWRLCPAVRISHCLAYA
jgi:hypothetical protein